MSHNFYNTILTICTYIHEVEKERERSTYYPEVGATPDIYCPNYFEHI